MTEPQKKVNAVALSETVGRSWSKAYFCLLPVNIQIPVTAKKTNAPQLNRYFVDELSPCDIFKGRVEEVGEISPFLHKRGKGKEEM